MRRPLLKMVQSDAMVAKKSSARKPQAKKPSKEQARLWVQRLLPITLRHLDVEDTCVEERHWYWRRHNRRCEHFEHVRGALGLRYVGAYEQYLRYRPAMADLTSAHDTKLDELVLLLGSAFDRLCADPLFREKVEAVERDHGSSRGGPALTEAELGDDIAQMAQHTLNNVGELDPSYVIAPLWNAAREALREAARSELRRIEPKGEAFGDAVRALTKALREDQGVLGDQFNIAVIDASDDIADGYSSFDTVRDKLDRLAR